MIEQISYEEVTTIANAIRNSSQKMKEILDDTKKQMQMINTESTWKSGASEVLITKFNTLASKFDSFSMAVNNYATFLDNTVATYKAADTTISNKADELLKY